MRILLSLLLGMAVVMAASSAQAIITDWECADDGDGAVVCVASFDWQDYQLSIDGVQNWTPGHVLGSFTTDTELDPTVMNYVSLDNDTDFGWTSFLVTVTTNKTFTLSNALAWTPGDWTAAMTQPVQVGSDWIGSVNYTAGTPVPVGGTLDISYKMSFLGGINFCQEMAPVPEPSTLALLGIGGLSLLALALRKRG